MLTTIIIVVAIYFVAMLGIGWYGRRYSSTFDGYLSMGRSGGILLLMGSAIGANIGNGFVVGGAGGGATSGLAGSAYGLACAVSTLVAVFLCDFIYKHIYLTAIWSITPTSLLRYGMADPVGRERPSSMPSGKASRSQLSIRKRCLLTEKKSQTRLLVAFEAFSFIEQRSCSK